MVRGFVGGVSQYLIEVVWVACVHIVLRWVKNNGRGSNFGTLLKIMPNHLHQAGVTRILKYSPACESSYLFTCISTLPNILISNEW